MRLPTSFTTLAFLLAAVIPCIIASPVEQSVNDVALAERALTAHPNQCTSPSQVQWSANPGPAQLGRCSWRLLAVCIGVTAGVCWEACALGGPADPGCDACVAALGTVGCIECLRNDAMWTSLQQDLSPLQPQIVASLQTQYCAVPKVPAPLIQAPLAQPRTSTAVASPIASPVATS